MLKKIKLSCILLVLLMPPFFKQSLAATLPAGTEIKVRMDEPINSQIRKTGYQFRARVDNEFRVKNKVIIKQGAKAAGKITQMTRATKYTAAVIELTLTNLTINNRKVSVKSYPIAGKGEIEYPTALGETNLDRNEITASTGEKISNVIPVITKGSYIELSTGSVLYFILANDVIY